MCNGGEVTVAQRGSLKGSRERAAARRIEALELRKSGLSYRRIGERLDVSGPQAHRDVMRELKALAKIATKEADGVRVLEEYRLDALLEILWPQVEAGDQGAVDRALRIMQRRAALRGLDAPTKIAPTDPTGEKEYTALTDDERATRIEAIINARQISA